MLRPRRINMIWAKLHKTETSQQTKEINIYTYKINPTVILVAQNCIYKYIYFYIYVCVCIEQ